MTRGGHRRSIPGRAGLADYQSLAETAYLLRSSVGARRLLKSVEESHNLGGSDGC